MKRKSDDDAIFTIKQVSEMTGLNIATLYAITKYDKLPSEEIGQRRVIRKEVMDKWLEGNLKPTDKEAGKK